MEKPSSDEEFGILFSTPQWCANNDRGKSDASAPGMHLVLVYDYTQLDFDELQQLLGECDCRPLASDSTGNLAENYRNFAENCFEVIADVIRKKQGSDVLLQIVIPDSINNRIALGISGLLKTAATEYPKFVGQLILVSPETTANELAGYLSADSFTPQDTIIKYENATRYVLRMKEIDVDPVSATVVLKDSGVYLITGGRGGLGTLFAKEINRQCSNARVILTGRSSATVVESKDLQELASGNNLIQYKKMDLADAADVGRVVNEVVAEYGRLNGIFHAAGMVQDSFITTKKMDGFRRVLEPKVSGTLNLDVASMDLDLDFMVLFSSAASVLGNVGQGDYAAANGFLDQFSQFRNSLVQAKQRKGRTLAVNWSYWRESRILPDQATQEMFKKTLGIHPLPTDRGMQAFYRCFTVDSDSVMVVPGRISKLRATFKRLSSVDQHANPEKITGSESETSVARGYLSPVKKTREEMERELSALFEIA